MQLQVISYVNILKLVQCRTAEIKEGIAVFSSQGPGRFALSIDFEVNRYVF